MYIKASVISCKIKSVSDPKDLGIFSASRHHICRRQYAIIGIFDQCKVIPIDLYLKQALLARLGIHLHAKDLIIKLLYIFGKMIFDTFMLD